ncbi:pre-mRNA-processing factor 17 [Scyliorhinus canicula]|uniref:pre-mRNA-processing factor 17 n=1 Tax=Scyliorhinus canicula TaxID=7830 RepID=UPI0018F52391|nr:pre-mRNA-processing factor 17 [Scyliorhinus canicula]
MSAIAALASYGSGSDSGDDSDGGCGQVASPDAVAHLNPLPSEKSVSRLYGSLVLNSAPEVAVKEGVETGVHLDPLLKEVMFNPSYETMFAPEFGPVNPFRTQQMAAPRNMLSGYTESAHINDFMFEQQRRTFHSYGYALDPTVDHSEVPGGGGYIGSVEDAEKNQGLTVFESGKKKTEKRKKLKEPDPANIDGFQGPWAKYVDEKDVAKPSEEEQKELDEIIAKRQKKGKQEDEKPAEEKTILHLKDMYDYQGRSYLHIPQDLGINLRSGQPPEKCYLPKKQMHVWTGHTKVSFKFLLAHFYNANCHLSISFPNMYKNQIFFLQWDVRSGEIVQEYDRHLGAVNTITFVDENRRFVSTSDDKSLRVWEWDIPVDFKYIAEPSMHSMPAVTLSPNGKWLACQSMDNQILIFGAQNRFRLNKKKIFKGHMVAGYACQVDFSPDMSYVASGDADGKLNIWDWKTTKLYSRIKAHDKVCISAIWHPHETSKVITCGWDGQIKLWD